MGITTINLPWLDKSQPNLKNYKKCTVKAAKELGYAPEFIEKIESAKTECEIDRIMKTARAKRFEMFDEVQD